MKKFNRISAGVAAVATALMLSTVPAGAADIFSASSGSSSAKVPPGNGSGSNTGNTVNVDGVMLSPREAEVVKGLNSYRASKGLKALKVRGDLVAQSRSWSGVMAAQNNLYHSNYNVWENIAYSPNGTATNVLTQWKNSPSHNRAMLESSISYVGFGQAKNSKGASYSTLQMI